MKVMLLMWSDGSYACGDADEDYAALAKTYPTPPASAEAAPTNDAVKPL